MKMAVKNYPETIEDIEEVLDSKNIAYERKDVFRDIEPEEYDFLTDHVDEVGCYILESGEYSFLTSIELGEKEGEKVVGISGEVENRIQDLQFQELVNKILDENQYIEAIGDEDEPRDYLFHHN